MCLQADDEKIVSGSWDNTIKRWALASGKLERTFTGHTAGVTCLQYEGDRLVSGSGDKTVRVWSLETGDCLHILQGHTDLLRCLRFSRGILYTGSFDETVKLWNLDLLQCVETLTGHTKGIRSLVVDRERLVVASRDGTVSVWDLGTSPGIRRTLLWDPLAVNMPKAVLPRVDFGTLETTSEQQGLNDFYFVQADFRRVVAGSSDCSLKIWDFDTQ